jgi:hypothetical protein
MLLNAVGTGRDRSIRAREIREEGLHQFVAAPVDGEPLEVTHGGTEYFQLDLEEAWRWGPCFAG